MRKSQPSLPGLPHSRLTLRRLPLASCLLAALALLLADAGMAQMKRDVQKPSKAPTIRSSSGSSGGSSARSGGPSARSGRSGGAKASARSGSGRHGKGDSMQRRGGSRSHKTYGGGYDRGYRGDRHRGYHRDRSYRSHHRHYRGCGHYGYSSFYLHGGYRAPFWYGPYYYGYYGYGWWPYGEVYRHYPVYRSSYGSALGALDLDVKPEKAEIYVDGRYVGVADQYDGFPAYLWLEQGTYEISLYKDGYATVTREIAVTPEAVISVDDRMVPGDAVRPEPVEDSRADTAKSEWAKKEDQWRERARDYRARKEAEGRAPEADSSEGVLDARQEPGRLRLDVTPRDASVYLDGRFLGSAKDLAALHSGLLVDPGEHELEIVRPGYESATVSVSVDGGDEEEVEVRLTAATGEDA